MALLTLWTHVCTNFVSDFCLINPSSAKMCAADFYRFFFIDFKCLAMMTLLCMVSSKPDPAESMSKDLFLI